ncbi:MAG: hypothetical protein EUB_03476 [Eubacterium sp.]
MGFTICYPFAHDSFHSIGYLDSLQFCTCELVLGTSFIFIDVQLGVVIFNGYILYIACFFDLKGYVRRFHIAVRRFFFSEDIIAWGQHTVYFFYFAFLAGPFRNRVACWLTAAIRLINRQLGAAKQLFMFSFITVGIYLMNINFCIIFQNLKIIGVLFCGSVILIFKEGYNFFIMSVGSGILHLAIFINVGIQVAVWH